VDVHRIRVGKYRVIYEVQGIELVIEVIRVGHRKDVYR
jgi:mRNA interferase RelE/StbE